MSVNQNNKGRWEVRIQYKNIRKRGGSFLSELEAKKAEKKTLKELKALEEIGVDNCGKYEPDFEESNKGAINRLIAAYRKRKAEHLKDKKTTEKLEAL